MNLFVLVYFTAIGIGLFLFMTRRKKSFVLVCLYLASVPFFGLMYDFGLQINLDRFWAFLMLLFLLTFKLKNKVYFPVYLFISYIFLDTILLSQFLPDTVKEFPFLRGEYRWIAQLVMWTILIAPVFFISKTIKTLDEVIRAYSILIYSVAILCVLGVVQYISLYIFNFDPFPIGLLQHGSERTGCMQYAGISIFRVSSLGGEPKHFAYSIAIALPLLIGIHTFNIKKVRFYKIILILMFINLLLTFSTQGYALFTTNFLIFLFIILYKKGISKRIVNIFLLVFVIFIILSQIPLANELIKMRTVERFAESGVIEDWNEAVLGFIKDHPQWLLTGVGLGNIHLYAQDYIPPYAYSYMAGNVFTAKSGLLRVVSELGIIGLILFLYAYINPMKILKFTKENDVVLLQIVLSIYTLISFLLTADGPSYIFMILGMQYALYRIKVKEESLRSLKYDKNNDYS